MYILAYIYLTILLVLIVPILLYARTLPDLSFFLDERPLSNLLVPNHAANRHQFALVANHQDLPRPQNHRRVG